MQHFKVPTIMVVWSDDSPESPHYVATPLWNCRPDPLHWLVTFTEAHILRDEDGTVIVGNPPDFARVFLPPAALGALNVDRLSDYHEAVGDHLAETMDIPRPAA